MELIQAQSGDAALESQHLREGLKLGSSHSRPARAQSHLKKTTLLLLLIAIDFILNLNILQLFNTHKVDAGITVCR